MSEANSIQESNHKLIFSLLLPVIACILLVVTCGASLYHGAVNNVWSLEFEKYIMERAVSFQPAPTQHPRAVLWLARDALVHNDPVKAQTLVSNLANSGDKDALVILGDSFAAQGQFSTAVNAWKNAGAFASLSSAAKTAKSAGRLDNALLALRAAYSLNPEAGTDSLATFLLDSKKDLQGATILLLTSIQQFPNSANQAVWCSLLARAYTKEKQYTEADNWYAQAIAFDPKNKSYWISRANVARDNGGLSHALDLYAQAAEQFPGYAPIYYEMAWAYKLAGSNTDAIQTIEKTIQLMDPLNASYEVRAGKIFENAGRMDEALQAYRAAQSIDPGSGTSSLISYYRYTLKDSNGAISVLKQAIIDYPSVTQHTSWMLQLAGMYRDASSWSDAKVVYQKILAQDPKNMDAHIGLGWVDYSAGEGISAAQAEFQQAINVAPERGEGYLATGEVLVREKRYSEADNWFAEAIKRAPATSGWWVERGNAARSAGNLNGAIEIYNQAIQQFQNFASAYYELAWAYRLNNDKNDSIQAIENAIGCVPTPSEWYYVRAGQIYEWAEIKDQAIIEYREALKLNPDNTSAQQGLSRLDK